MGEARHVSRLFGAPYLEPDEGTDPSPGDAPLAEPVPAGDLTPAEEPARDTSAPSAAEEARALDAFRAKLEAGRPTQADLAKIVDAKAALEADMKWDDPVELQIHALIHRAWAMEIERKGGQVSQIGSDDVKALRMAQAAIRLVPKRAMAAVG